MAELNATTETVHMMKPEGIEFLRASGLPPEACRILATGEVMTISGDTLAGWLRHTYQLGQQSMRDHFVWFSVADLMEGPPHA